MASNTFSIFEDRENIETSRKTRKENLPIASKRPVLGVVNANTRLQPIRLTANKPLSKQESRNLPDENACLKPKRQQQFQPKQRLPLKELSLQQLVVGDDVAFTKEQKTTLPQFKGQKAKIEDDIASEKDQKTTVPHVKGQKVKTEDENCVKSVAASDKCLSSAAQKVKVLSDTLGKLSSTDAAKKTQEACSSIASVTNEDIQDLPESISNLPPKAEEECIIISSSPEPDADTSEESVEKSDMVLDTSIEQEIGTQRQPSEHFLNCEDYRQEIYMYLREAETRHRPKPGYMIKQPDISFSMRSILVDWLVEVTEEYKLQAETLFLAVSYIDRFLSQMSVVRGKLQLVGTAAMFIASKYEEIYPPDVSEFVYITDDTYTKKQVLRMEHLILRVLSFGLSGPTPLCFVTKFCTYSKVDETTTYLAMYLSELTLLDGEHYLQFLPSQIAGAAVALARHTVGLEPWCEVLEKYTNYVLEELKDCLSQLYETFSNASTYPQQAIRDKYKSSRWNNVAHFTPRYPRPC